MPIARFHLIMPILIAGSALGLLASVIYVPSLPDMARQLHTGVDRVQLTLTAFLVVFASSMLIQGPLADRFGRRRVFLLGLGLCLIASVAATAAPTIELLLATRLVQAFGACATLVVARAMIRDLFDREAAARAFALIAMATALAPAFGPLLGGQLHVTFGWRANFAFITLWCAVLLAAAWWHLPETNPGQPVRVSLLAGMAAAYWTLLRSRAFFAYSLVIAAGATGFFAFAAGAPVLLIEHFGVSPDRYGLYSAIPPTGFITGSFLSHRLTARLGVNRMVGAGSLVAAGAGVLLVALAMAEVGNVALLLAPMYLFGIGNGLTWPNASAGALSLHPQIAGTASALTGFMQMGGATVGTAISALLDFGSARPLALLIASAGCSGAVLWRLMALHRRPPPTA